MRIGVVGVMIIILIVAMVGGILPDYDIPCYWDAGFDVFGSAN